VVVNAKQNDNKDRGSRRGLEAASTWAPNAEVLYDGCHRSLQVNASAAVRVLEVSFEDQSSSNTVPSRSDVGISRIEQF
jgi:hypothetical protein